MRVLFLLLCLSTAVNSIVALYLYRRERLGAALWWAVGTALVCAGLFVVFIRDHIGAEFSIFVTNTLTLAGFAIVWDGMRRFVGRRFSRTATVLSLLVVGVGSLANYWFSMVDFSFAGRVSITSLGLLFFSLTISSTLLSSKLASRPVLFLGAVYSANVFVCGVRVIAPLLSPEIVSLLQSASASIAYLVFTIAFSVCVTLGQVAVVREESRSSI